LSDINLVDRGVGSAHLVDPQKPRISVTIAPGVLAGQPSRIENIDCGGLDPLMAQHFLLTACIQLGMDSRNAMAMMQQAAMQAQPQQQAQQQQIFDPRRR
jgi:hypothetical protein